MQHYINKNWRWPLHPNAGQPTEQVSQFLGLPSEIIEIVLQESNLFDVIMLRTVCKSLYNLIADAHLFPKHFVLDQQKCLEYYVTLGNISALEYLHAMNFFFTPSLCVRAAESGRLDVIKYLRDNGCHLDYGTHYALTTSGHLDVLEYILEGQTEDNLKEAYGPMCVQYLFSASASAGHLHIVKYLHEKGFGWETNTIYEACQNDHFEVFKYAIENGCPYEPIHPPIGHIKFMKYLEEREIPWKYRACKDAASKGNLDALKYAHEHGCVWQDAVNNNMAAAHGHLECLKYAVEHGAPVGDIHSVKSIEILEYLIQHTTANLTDWIYTSALSKNTDRNIIYYMLKHTTVAPPPHFAVQIAQTGDLELFKFAIENKFNAAPIHDEFEFASDIYMAIVSSDYTSGSLDCLKYAVEKKLGRFYDDWLVYFRHMLVSNIPQKIDMIKWWLENLPYKFRNQDLINVVKGESIEILELLIEKGIKFNEEHLNIASELDSPLVLAYMLKQGHYKNWKIGYYASQLSCIKYAHEHGYEWSLDCLINLSFGDSVEVLQYLLEQRIVERGTALKMSAKKHANQWKRYLTELKDLPANKKKKKSSAKIKEAFSKLWK